MGKGWGDLTQKWHSWALNMRKLTRVDLILFFVCLKNRFLFHRSFFKLIFDRQRGREERRKKCLRRRWQRWRTSRLTPAPLLLAGLRRDSHATASVPLGNELQNLTDGDGLTFVPQGEPSHLGEVFKGLKADGSSGAQAGDAHLVLFDEARSRLTLLSWLFVYQTD